LRALLQDLNNPLAEVEENLVQEIEESIKEVQETMAAYKQSTQETINDSADLPVNR
jgi:uncharacterized protein YtpQ (UPF0354 family)